MKTPRLDWMKFNVYDFVHSEDVEAMSAEEVGQYILLMAAAWVGGKDCTLPNDEGYLERKARGTVSAKVMKKFTQTTDGRLANEVQREIWNEQQGMWSAASEAGKRGRAKQLGKTPETNSGGGPGVAPAESGDAPGDKMRCDGNGIDKKKPEHNALHSQPQGSSANDPFANEDITTSNSNGHQHPPSPLSSKETTRVPSSHPLTYDQHKMVSEDAGLPVPVPSAQRMAQLFYEYLPPEVQADAPATWETLWANDFNDLLETESLPIVDAVAKFSQTSAKWQKYIKRGAKFVELYPRIKADWEKLRKAGKLPAKPPQTVTGQELEDL